MIIGKYKRTTVRELKKKKLQEARRRNAEGQSKNKVAKALGTNERTLRKR